MAFLPSFWRKSSPNSQKKSPERKRSVRKHEARKLRIEGLESREMLATVALNADALALGSTLLVITGSGFSPVVADDHVTFTDGTGTNQPHGDVISATPTELQVEFASDQLVNVGDLSVEVVVTGDPTHGANQVATIVPLVTENTDTVVGNTVVIAGSGFSTTTDNDWVFFYDANNNLLNATGLHPEAGATAISLTVDFSSLTDIPGGALYAKVVVDGTSPAATDPGSAKTQVGTVVPTVTTKTDAYYVGSGSTLLIEGTGFDTTEANNIVTFDNGAVGTVTNATATSLTIDFTSGTAPTTLGALQAFITVNGVDVGATPVTVATVTQTVNNNTTSPQVVAIDATTMTIKGKGFSLTASENTVALYSDAIGTVSAEGTVTGVAVDGGTGLMTLTVTFTANPTATGDLYAKVTTGGVDSAVVQVATIGPGVTANTANRVSGDATAITINGAGFDGTTLGNNVVLFYDDAAKTTLIATGTVEVGSTATSLVVTFDTTPVAVGTLYVQVTTSGAASAVVQVATVIPSVTDTSATSVLVTDTSVTVTITGSGFDNAHATNSVTFTNGGRTYTVTGITATNATSLDATISGATFAAGPLNAVVTVNGYSSSAPVVVATVVPVVRNNTQNAQTVALTANTMTIKGKGFSTTAGNNTVELTSDGTTVSAQGTVTAVSVDGDGLMTLTVTFTTGHKPTATGALYAKVTSNSAVSSAVQVALIAPVITANTANLARGAATMTIDGVGFDTGTPGSNKVVFYSTAGGAPSTVTGTVTNAVGTGVITLTITFDSGYEPSTFGNLYATVQVTGGGISAIVQVATVAPVVTNNSGSRIAANASTMYIAGAGFSTTAANDVLIFNDGARGHVTAATSTLLTVLFDTKPVTAGSLTATVLVNGVSSGLPVQVATVSVVVTATTTNKLPATATTVTIAGYGFDPTNTANNVVAFYSDAAGTAPSTATGHVSAATANLLTVTFDTLPTTVGALYAKVTVGGTTNTAAQVATIAPAVTSSTLSFPANVTTLAIAGSGFSTTLSKNTVTFNNGATGYVSVATTSSLTVTFLTRPTAGALTAIVTTSGVTSGTAVQVATIAPTVTATSAAYYVGADTLIIQGSGFSTTLVNDHVIFDGGAVGTITGATATSLTIDFTGGGCVKPTTVGALKAIVTVNGVANSSPVTVATVTPTVNNTSATQTMAINAATMTIKGRGFSVTPGNNTVALYSDAGGTVASGSGTVTAISVDGDGLMTLTVTLATSPTAVGDLYAKVTIGGVVSDVVKVAKVGPGITASTANLAIDPSAPYTEIVINGVSFNGSTDVVTFYSDAAGTVVAAQGTVVARSSTTGLTVRFTAGQEPNDVGALYAKVNTNGASGSDSPVVQVATVIPFVTDVSQASQTVLATTTSVTVTISGTGFDSAHATNSVTFTNGGRTYTVTGITATSGTSLQATIGSATFTAGTLDAVVTVNGCSSGSPVAVATIVPDVNDTSSQTVAIDANTMTIKGKGFSTTTGDNTVALYSDSNGAVVAAQGTVTTVSVDSEGLMTLTVTFTSGHKPSAAGALYAKVTSNSADSDVVQVAMVAPVINSNSASLAIGATTMTISGIGFDWATPGNNTVVFNDINVVGTVTGAVDDSGVVTLTVTFLSGSEPGTFGSLLAAVTTNGATSEMVQVATIAPTVVANSSNPIAADATSMTIAGTGFDATAGNNLVVFNNGAIGHVTAATSTSLTVAFDTKPTTAGSLTATVIVNGLSSGAPMAVGTVNVVVTGTTTNKIAVGATTVTIAGYGFDPTNLAFNGVKFYSDAAGTTELTTGTVGAGSTATSLIVTFAAAPTTVGALYAKVTWNNTASTASAVVQVATVAPAVTSDTTSFGASLSTLIIRGSGFIATPNQSMNSVTFNNGATGYVSDATATSLTVTFLTKPTAGALTAIVTTDGVTSGSAVQVATIKPSVTSATTPVSVNDTTITIYGVGFSATAGSNLINFYSDAEGTTIVATGHVTAATATSLAVTFDQHPTAAGALYATVLTNSVSSGAAIQVGVVQLSVQSNTANLDITTTSLDIYGVGFDLTTLTNNTVKFYKADGVTLVGTITGSAITSTATNTLTVDISSLSSSLVVGALKAVVTVTSGTTVSSAVTQVATVVPVVTASTTNSFNLTANGLTISGRGFDATAGNNTVAFYSDAAGTVIAATGTVTSVTGGTSLAVTFTTKPSALGNLYAKVTTNGATSSVMQIGKVVPVVTDSTVSLAPTATSLVINGYGFSTVSGENSVTLYASDGTTAYGTVSVNTTDTHQLTVSLTGLTTSPLAGALYAVVTVGTGDNAFASSMQQAATVTPAVTTASGSLLANATTLTINGNGFTGVTTVTLYKADGTTAYGTITLDPDQVTTTTLTVTIPGSYHLTAGMLKAVVTSNGVSSGSPVQVAAVSPVVTAPSSTNYISLTDTSITIAGHGFDPTAGNNTVVFYSDAAGTVVAAVGTVTSVGTNGTSLNVTFTTKPSAMGDLYAKVTTNGSSYQSEVTKVGTVLPSVTASTTAVAPTAHSITIIGSGFSTTPGENSVNLYAADGTTLYGTISGADVVATGSTTLTVNITGLTTSLVGGALKASVSVTSGTDIFSSAVTQVGVVTLSITSTSTNYFGVNNTTSLTINGLGFDTTTPTNNTVRLYKADGAIVATATVDVATATSLTVTIPGTATLTLGDLMAVVTLDNGQTSGTAVQVATVVPVVTPNAGYRIAVNATSVTITGYGFDTTTCTNNLITFNNGAQGSVIAAVEGDGGLVTLTVTITTRPSVAGALTASVSTSGYSSTTVQVADAYPIITSSTANLSASSTTLVINGFGFDTSDVTHNNLVTFSNGALGTVTAVNTAGTSMTVTFDTKPYGGALTASVTVDGVTSGTAVQVATVVPVITSSTASRAFNATTVVIDGYGFDSTLLTNNVITFVGGATGTVTAASLTSITVTFDSGHSPAAVGSLSASVAVNTVSSGTAVQIATMVPVVTSATTSLAADATTVTINGYGFSGTIGENLVTFNNGATGTVTAASATQLTVTFDSGHKPAAVGSLTASVTTNSVSSGSLVQIATVIPAVTISSADLLANASTITITGAGFASGSTTVTLLHQRRRDDGRRGWRRHLGDRRHVDGRDLQHSAGRRPLVRQGHRRQLQQRRDGHPGGHREAGRDDPIAHDQPLHHRQHDRHQRLRLQHYVGQQRGRVL